MISHINIYCFWGVLGQKMSFFKNFQIEFWSEKFCQKWFHWQLTSIIKVIAFWALKNSFQNDLTFYVRGGIGCPSQPRIGLRDIIKLKVLFVQDKPIVWNTYQCYLKEALNTISSEMEVVQSLGTDEQVNKSQIHK